MALRHTETVVYVILSRGWEKPDHTLQEATSLSGGHLFNGAGAGLDDVFRRAIDDFRMRYVLTCTPKAVGQHDGWHRLAVRIRNHDYRVTARRGYVS